MKFLIKKNIVVICALVSLVVLVGFVCSGCSMLSPHKVVSKDDFVKAGQDAGYTVRDMTDSAKTQAGLSTDIKNAIGPVTLIGTSSDNATSLHIELWEMADNENAANVFEVNRRNIDEYKGTTLTLENGSYQVYEKTADRFEKFFKLVQVDNTFIYSYSTQDRRDELNNFIASLGY